MRLKNGNSPGPSFQTWSWNEAVGWLCEATDHTHPLTTSLNVPHGAVKVWYALEAEPLKQQCLDAVVKLLSVEVAKVVDISSLTGDGDTL